LAQGVVLAPPHRIQQPLQPPLAGFGQGRFIADFRWKEHDAYQKALDRLLRDLRIEAA
jgi:hypothetical protein